LNAPLENGALIGSADKICATVFWLYWNHLAPGALPESGWQKHA
jgi:hypothetical protein